MLQSGMLGSSMQETHHEQPRPFGTIQAGTVEVYVELRCYADSSYKIEATHVHELLIHVRP